MSANGWTRADHVRLGTIAMQAGFATAEEAEPALMIGVRMVAHGFTSEDIDRMIQHHYAEAAESERRRAAATARFVDERDPACVAAWPECASGEYDPRCCRFPKSCSAGNVRIVREAEGVNDERPR